MSQGPRPSGIRTLPTPDATRYIPESRRPDGSLRPARRVKEGYVPPEDIAKYTVRRGGLGGPRSPGLGGLRSPGLNGPRSPGGSHYSSPDGPKSSVSGIVSGELRREPLDRDRSRISSLDDPGRASSASPFDDPVKNSTSLPLDDAVKTLTTSPFDDPVKAPSAVKSRSPEKDVIHFQKALQGILKEKKGAPKEERKAPEKATEEKKLAEKESLADPERRVKTIRKKLRQIQEIQEKVDKEEEVLPEQRSRLDGVKALEEELASLTL
ncbi:hypothetical protein BJ684DRAFT_19133 [Piptocephalis cylindrospora]|uniref:WIBG Mago-binding domain-containing protein n=1 Tax=Piptocephalis cylindrospora TaxID=1907219 RepID=A0A4P9Y5X7_9FUNG|nr:hypothetical protein BJ684DRAFT_19133 [Piptocephalis cylindrospora]|eukprot:RKP14458.1 hypothetical protein BJ684DRAFT_19133 [Piptocephalis cylindrospora]